MIDETVDRKEGSTCSHLVCRCTLVGVIEGDSYCSDYCKEMDQSGVEGEQCGCGHPECDTP